MKTCPYCAENIQSEAIKCRYCGEWLDNNHSPAQMSQAGTMGRYGWNYEYKSDAEISGWPLIHIAYGNNPETGKPRIARGIIAIGNIAIGALALGSVAIGGFSLGGLGLGIFSFGGVSVGIIAALGGLALGGSIAMGGLAVSLSYAIGGWAIAPHIIGGNGIDPEFLWILQQIWPDFRP